MTRSRCIFAALLGVLAILSVYPHSTFGQSPDPPVASDGDLPFQIGEPVADTSVALILTYNNATRTVSAESYEQSVQSMTRGRPIPSGQETAVHRQAVISQVVRMATTHADEIQSLDVDTAAVGEQFRQQRARFPDSTAFSDALSQAGMTEDSLRSMIASSLRMNAYRDTVAETVEAPPADSVESYAEEQGTVGARHILLQVEPGMSEENIDSLRTVAASLIDSVNAGADFARLAEEYSDGPSSSRGGDLGTFSRERMVKPFADAAFSMQDSSEVYPDPVRTEYGFHVIQLTEAPQPMEMEEARGALMEERVQTAFREEMERLMEDVMVRMNPDLVPLATSDLRK
ncbi:peptidylprolyl isomerase [Longibacter salinarum]|nr:peptidylprolyl isomerase [Longibacter salinarum]